VLLGAGAVLAPVGAAVTEPGADALGVPEGLTEALGATGALLIAGGMLLTAGGVLLFGGTTLLAAGVMLDTMGAADEALGALDMTPPVVGCAVGVPPPSSLFPQCVNATDAAKPMPTETKERIRIQSLTIRSGV
jgi:hypothetical protein